MLILNKPLAIVGMLTASLSTVLCPFVKGPLVSAWNMYQTDYYLFFITIGLLGLSLLMFVMRFIRAYQISTYVFFVWYLISLGGVYFKVNNYFGLKLFDGLLSKTIHLKYGWLVLLLGALIMILSVRKIKEVK